MHRAAVQVDGDGAEVGVLLQRELALVQLLRLRVVDLQHGCLCRHTSHCPRHTRLSRGTLRPTRSEHRTPDTGHTRAVTDVRSVQEFKSMALAHI